MYWGYIRVILGYKMETTISFNSSFHFLFHYPYITLYYLPYTIPIFPSVPFLHASRLGGRVSACLSRHAARHLTIFPSHETWNPTKNPMKTTGRLKGSNGFHARFGEGRLTHSSSAAHAERQPLPHLQSESSAHLPTFYARSLWIVHVLPDWGPPQNKTYRWV